MKEDQYELFRDILVDIFGNTEASEKITIEFDEISKTFNVKYENCDPEWFKELIEANREGLT